MNKKTNFRQAGITLVALVVTIIVLLILAGVTLTLVLNNNGILSRAQYGSNTWANATKDEDRAMGQFSSDVDTLTEGFINREGGSGGGGSQTDPAVEYGYKNKTGVVEANTLIAGDVINYYYSKTQEPISCVVIYNDESHGLQVISEDTVRDVILGCNTDGTMIDPRAVQAFAIENPDGYDNTNLEKSRWSYNHAIETLNAYAQEYLGLMSENARCIGAPANDIVLNEDETTNMFTNENYADFSYYNGKLKNIDNNISGTYYADYVGSVSEDLSTLATLGIVRTPTSKACWLASRYINSSSGHATFYVTVLEENGFLGKGMAFLWYKSSTNSPECRSYTNGFRPIITLKANIKVEKIRHQDFGSGAFPIPYD